MQWKNVYCPTFTSMCNSATNWLDYGNSFSGKQTDCLWQTICILERHLLVSAEPTFKLLDVTKHKHWWKLSLSSLTFLWPRSSAHCNCEFVQMNHPSYSPDLAPSNYFLIRNLKYHLHGTRFTDDESDDRYRGMGWESKQIIIFLGHKQLRRKVEKMHWCCRTICRKMTVCVIYV